MRLGILSDVIITGPKQLHARHCYCILPNNSEPHVNPITRSLRLEHFPEMKVTSSWMLLSPCFQSDHRGMIVM